MLKRALVYFTLFLCISLSTGCFDILEEIQLNKDGSGTIMVTLNMSKSKTKLASLMLLDSVNGHKIPSEDDINEFFKDAIYHLEKTPGISNIKKTKDFSNYVFTLSCDFNSVENVNIIFKDLIKNKGTNNYTNLSYNPSAHYFKRHFTQEELIKKSFYKLKSEDRKVFDGASYTCIYRFQDKVKAVSNTDAKIAPNKGAVFLKIDALSLILGEKNIQNKIELTK
ncbi:hypothetical protein [Maribacter luteus]|uniref:hypothetical protein n=1 Tax=Maribacter luteus TaxID=2594478 RepID=UPI00248F87B2|nr:hypothetical protein [Maribacter luteus]